MSTHAPHTSYSLPVVDTSKMSEAERLVAIKHLCDALAHIAKAEFTREGRKTLYGFGKPSRWWDDPTWRCPGGHVSKTYLKSEARGGVCLACFEAIALTFPEDKEETTKS